MVESPTGGWEACFFSKCGKDGKFQMKEANVMIDFTFTANKQPEEKTNKQAKRNRF